MILAAAHPVPRVTGRVPASQGPSCSTRRAMAVRTACQAAPHDMERRHALIGMLGAGCFLPSAAAQAQELGSQVSVDQLNTFQKADIIADVQRRALKALKQELTAADASSALRLVLHDAATYNVATGTGGVDGSIVTSEELDRPENKSLVPLVKRLSKVKAELDGQAEKRGQAPISWADLIVLAGAAAASLDWKAIKLGRATDAAGGEIIASQLATPIPVSLGRGDSPAPNPSPIIPIPTENASPQEVKDFFNRLGNPSSDNGEGLFSRKPPFFPRAAFVLWTAAQPDPAAAEAKLATDPAFAEWKTSYDRSRRTVTRNNYEVDFGTYYERLANLGAKFDRTRYLIPLKTANIPRL
ncbi:hypothetical protein ACKKBG_A14095 [Auxenochlorella protothecoides x Auxenochlorella symbiontica]